MVTSRGERRRTNSVPCRPKGGARQPDGVTGTLWVAAGVGDGGGFSSAGTGISMGEAAPVSGGADIGPGRGIGMESGAADVAVLP